MSIERRSPRKHWEPYVRASAVKVTHADGTVTYQKPLGYKELKAIKTRQPRSEPKLGKRARAANTRRGIDPLSTLSDVRGKPSSK